MIAQNLHTENDTSIFTWKVMCGQPVIANDWTMTFNPYIRPGEIVTLSLTTIEGSNLPTNPVLRIVQIEGFQRIDQELTVKNASAIPFFLSYGATDQILACDDFGATCFEDYQFLSMGVDPNLKAG